MIKIETIWCVYVDFRRNVGTEEAVEQSFFFELEEPKNWLSTDVSIHFVHSIFFFPYLCFLHLVSVV